MPEYQNNPDLAEIDMTEEEIDAMIASGVEVEVIGRLITDEINADPEEVARLRWSRANARKSDLRPPVPDPVTCVVCGYVNADRVWDEEEWISDFGWWGVAFHCRRSCYLQGEEYKKVMAADGKS